MSTHAPPAVRRVPSTPVLSALLTASLVAAVLIGVLVASDPVTTETPTSDAPAAVESTSRAARVAVIAAQLDALRQLAVADPVVGSALEEDIATLRAALAGDIPLEAVLPAPTDASGGYSSPPGRYGSRAPAASPERGVAATAPHDAR